MIVMKFNPVAFNQLEPTQFYSLIDKRKIVIE